MHRGSSRGGAWELVAGEREPLLERLKRLRRRHGGGVSGRVALPAGAVARERLEALRGAPPMRLDAAAVVRVPFFKLFDPATYAGTLRALRAGHRLGMPGRRTNQLGATFVIGAGGELRYEHQDAHAADHASMDEIFAALRV